MIVYSAPTGFDLSDDLLSYYLTGSTNFQTCLGTHLISGINRQRILLFVVQVQVFQGCYPQLSHRHIDFSY